MTPKIPNRLVPSYHPPQTPDDEPHSNDSSRNLGNSLSSTSEDWLRFPVCSSSSEPQRHDPDVFDDELNSKSNEAEEDHTTKLSGWQMSMVHCWFDHKLRPLSRRELLAFETLLEVPQATLNKCIEKIIIEGKFVVTEYPPDITNGNTYHQNAREDGDEPPVPLNSTDRTITEPSYHAPCIDSCPGGTLNGESSDFPAASDAIPNACMGSAVPDLGMYSTQLPNISLPSFDSFQANQIRFPFNFFQNSETGSAISNQLPTREASVNRHKSTITTRALRRLIRFIIHNSMTSGCARNDSRQSQTGKYACTFGCGYRTTRMADLDRHEQVVYPQQFYFCAVCGDPGKPSKSLLFTRKDKILRHIKHVHGGTLTPTQCEVTGIPSAFPEECPLCLHCYHDSWKDRYEHIKWHYRCDHAFPNVARSQIVGQEHDLWDISSSDEDDEDDKHSGNDNDASQNQSDADGNDNNEGGDSDPSSGDKAGGDYGSGGDAGDDSDAGNYDIADWLQPQFLQLQHLHGGQSTLTSERLSRHDGSYVEYPPDTAQPDSSTRSRARSNTRGPHNVRRLLHEFNALAIYVRWQKQSYFMGNSTNAGGTMSACADPTASSLTAESLHERVELPSTMNPNIRRQVNELYYTGAQFDEEEWSQRPEAVPYSLY